LKAVKKQRKIVLIKIY